MKRISLFSLSVAAFVMLAGVASAAQYKFYPSDHLPLAVEHVPHFPGGTTPEPSKCTPGTDTDGDCVADADDNCPFTVNANQADANWDHIGDACATDWDNDTVNNDTDNCYSLANTDQADLDGDGAGDACDLDRDGDGYTDVYEASLGTDPANWDSDSDNVSDFYDCAKMDSTKAVSPDCDLITVIDNLPDNPDPIEPDFNEPGRDDDGDGINNGIDNCPIIFNPGQQDGDADGIGDLCDMLPGRRSEVLFIKGGGGSEGGCSLTAVTSGSSLVIDLLMALPALAMVLVRGRKSR